MTNYGATTDQIAEETAGDPSMPPNAVLCERRLCASMLINGVRMAGPVAHSDFYSNWYARLFQTMKDLAERYPEAAIGPIEVKDELFRQHHLGHLPDLGDRCYDLIDMLPWAYGSDTGYVIERILETAEERLVRQIGARLTNTKDDDAAQLLATAQEELKSIRIRMGGSDIERTRFVELVREQKLSYATTMPTAIPTGLVDLDHMLNGGLRPGTLNVVGARPGVGKSLFSCTIARNIAELGTHRVLYVTLELTKAELTNRILANVANIELTHLQNPEQINDWDHLRIGEAHLQVKDWPLHIEEGSRTIAQIEQLAGSYFSGSPGGLLIVDFLQRIREDGNAVSRERHVAMAASRLTDLAHDLNIPVVCVVSFSRDSARRGGQPRMDDIRDSGGVESDADTVILMWHDNDRDLNTIDVVIDKNRYGIEGLMQLTKQGHRGRVANAMTRGEWAA